LYGQERLLFYNRYYRGWNLHACHGLRGRAVTQPDPDNFTEIDGMLTVKPERVKENEEWLDSLLDKKMDKEDRDAQSV
jgi:hypothetical protein